MHVGLMPRYVTHNTPHFQNRHHSDTYVWRSLILEVVRCRLSAARQRSTGAPVWFTVFDCVQHKGVATWIIVQNGYGLR